MNRILFKLVVVVGLAFVVSVSSAFAQEEVPMPAPAPEQGEEQAPPSQLSPSEGGLVGTYECVGVGPNGPYHGIVEVKTKEDLGAQGIYRLRWTVPGPDGSNAYTHGWGLMRDSRFATGFLGGGGILGTAVFKVEENGLRLSGEWTTGPDGAFPETWIKLSDGPLPLPELPPTQPPQRRPQTRPAKAL